MGKGKIARGARWQPIVKLAGIGRRYGTDAPVVALRGIDLEVRAGEWVAVGARTGPAVVISDRVGDRRADTPVDPLVGCPLSRRVGLARVALRRRGQPDLTQPAAGLPLREDDRRDRAPGPRRRELVRHRHGPSGGPVSQGAGRVVVKVRKNDFFGPLVKNYVFKFG